ncbi:MAG: NRDE family protein [Novosphingobium sp.]|nr:NRDE family protein [Novosphingobium sp.]
MCVAAIAWRAHPKWPLVAIGNRDEYHARPSAPLARWGDGSGILAGRDLAGGGTWLGVSEAGRFALVTNLRGYEAPDPARRSRGALVAALLAGEAVESVAPEAYNPFNLLAAADGRLEYVTNRPEPVRTELGHGVYGLSNGALDEPWPKTLALKAALTDWLAAGDNALAPLFAALASEDRPAIGLPPREPSDVAVEPRDTPPFIRAPLYGTRCSTVVTVAGDGAGRIVERRFSAQAEFEEETRLDFVWPGPIGGS